MSGNAAAAVDFTQLLAQKPDDTVMPAPLPQGTYSATIRGHETGVSSQKKTPYVEFKFGGFQPQADVDQTDWQNWASVGGRQEKATMSTEFYLTENALFMLKNFLEEVCGISTQGRSYADCLAETPNISVLISVKHTISQKDNKTIYAEIQSIAKAA